MKTPVKQRKKIVQQAVANQKLEDLTVSKETIKLADNYIAGKASAAEVAKKIKARYGAL